MAVIDHISQPVEWRGIHKNIEHRTIVGADQGAQSLTVWEIYPPPGAGAPPHIHPHEETITVLQGSINAWFHGLRGETHEVHAGQTLFIPAKTEHQFVVLGDEKAHLLIVFPVKEVSWEYVAW